jgi:hypothetical protein
MKEWIFTKIGMNIVIRRSNDWTVGWVTSCVLYPPTAQWLYGISSLVIIWLEHDADSQTAIWCCDSPVNFLRDGPLNRCMCSTINVYVL